MSWIALAAAAMVAGAIVPARADGGTTATNGTAGSGVSAGGDTTASTASDQGASTSSTPDPAAAGLSTLGGAPPFGSAVRLGDVGTILNQSGGGALSGAAPAPFLTIVPSIGASEQFVTGGYGGRNGGGSQFVTSINPALLINGATQRTNFTLDYAPRVQLYSNQSRYDGVNQSLDASIDAVLLPQSLSVAARAYATDQATSGGLSPGGTSIYNRNNTTLSQSYSVTPTFNDTFELGTLDLLYSAQYTRQSGNAAFLQGANTPYFRTSDVFAQTEAGSFTTVPFFERFNDTPSFSATEDVGTGLLSGAHQYFIKDTLHYALTRFVVLSGSVGYEDIAYSGVPPTLIKDPTWSVGARIIFPDGGVLVARYQHIYGFNSPYIRGSYPLTAWTTLSIGYSEVLSTQQQGLGLGVASSGVNSIGLPIGGLSRQPVLLTNQSLSVQSGLTQNKQFSASLTTEMPRDTISFSVQAYQDRLIANSPGLSGFSQKGAYVSASDSHQVSARTNAVFYVNYGQTQSPALGASSTSTYGFSAALTYRLSPTIYTNAQYSLTNDAYTGFGSRGVQNIITVGIQKTF